MPIFENINGLVKPPSDQNDYSIFNIVPIISPPSDANDYEPSEENNDLPDSDSYGAPEQEPILPEGEGIGDLDLETELPISEPIGNLDSAPDLPPSLLHLGTIGEDTDLPLGDTIGEMDAVPIFPEGAIPLDLELFQPLGILPAGDELEDTVPFTQETPPADDETYTFETDTAGTSGSFTYVSPPDTGINWSNTWSDQLFTGLNNVLDFLGLPMPEGLTSIYQNIQTVEGFIEDPRMLLNLAVDKAKGFIFPGKKDGAWIDAKGLMGLPEDRRYELIDGIYKTNEVPFIEMTTQNVSDDQYLDGIIEDIGKEAFAFQGRKSAVGVTMRLNHLWDVKMKPYAHNGITFVPDMGTAESAFYGNETKNEKASRLGTEKYRRKTDAVNNKDWEDSMPVLSYDLDFKTLSNKEVELFGGATIMVPEIIRRTSHLSMQILDDENKRWRRWLQRYMEAMYNETNNIVKPYKHCCMQVTIYQYRADWKILSHKEFLVTLKNYQAISSGSGGGNGNADVIDLEWSIVGELKMYGEKDYLNII